MVVKYATEARNQYEAQSFSVCPCAAVAPCFKRYYLDPTINPYCHRPRFMP